MKRELEIFRHHNGEFKQKDSINAVNLRVMET